MNHPFYTYNIYWLLLLFGSLNFLSAQPDIEWTQSYGGSFSDIPNSIISKTNGGAVIAGSTLSNNYDIVTPLGKTDGWIINLAADNSINWARTYGTPGEDEIISIANANDEGYVAAGYSSTTDDENPVTQLWIFKINIAGNISWEIKLGDNGSSTPSKIIPVSDGYLILGQTNSPDFIDSGYRGLSDAFLMKIDNDGNEIWSRQWGGYANDFTKDLTILPNGNILVAGYADSPYNNYKGAMDGWISLLNNNGQLSWSRYFGGLYDDQLHAITADNNGNIYAAGFTYSKDIDIETNAGLRDSWLIKINEAGNLIWSKTYGGALHDEFNDLLFYNNQLLASGYTASGTGTSIDLLGRADYWLLEINEDGEPIWETNYGGDRADKITSLSTAADGGLYIAGTSRTIFNGQLGFTKGLEDFFIIKTTGIAALPLSVELGADESLCFGNSVELSADITNCQGCQISWNDGSSAANRTVTPAVTTTYSITIMDNTGQTAVDEITVNVFPNPTVSLDVIGNDFCEGENISINSTVNNCPGCTYLWDDGNTQLSRDLSLGTDKEYSVTITNSGGCTAESSVFIDVLESIDFSASTSNVNCFGLQNGSINLDINTPNITVEWDNGNTGNNLNNLSSGNYTVSLSGNGYCPTTATYTISQPNAINVIGSANDVTCSNLMDGSVNLSVDGGTTPYNYQWSSGANTSNVNNLPGGFYSVTVEDENGCIAVTGFEIQTPDPININSTIEAISCPGEMDGSIEITPSGGTGNFSILWSNGSTSSSLTNLSGESLNVAVTDGSGCSTTASFTIPEPISIGFNTTIEQPSPGNMDGSIFAIPNGGTPPYSLLWNTGDTGFNLDNLSPGTYSLSVTDGAGCTADIDFDLVFTNIENILLEENFIVSPNPNNGRFLVDLSLSESTDFKLAVYNVLGQRVWENEYRQAALLTEIDLNEVASGVYFVIVEMEVGVIARRMVLE